MRLLRRRTLRWIAQKWCCVRARWTTGTTLVWDKILYYSPHENGLLRNNEALATGTLYREVALILGSFVPYMTRGIYVSMIANEDGVKRRNVHCYTEGVFNSLITTNDAIQSSRELKHSFFCNVMKVCRYTQSRRRFRSWDTGPYTNSR